jgi:GAF domain-containing protein
MPDVMTLLIVGAVWAALLIVVWALCVAASHGDRQDARIHETASADRPTVVADTGAIRDHLQDALQLVEAEQLTVTVDIDGRPAVLASAPGVVEAAPGRRPSIAVPVRVGERKVATLEAVRPPGERRFDTGDTLMLRKVADTVAGAMETERSSISVPVRAPSAMA